MAKFLKRKVKENQKQIRYVYLRFFKQKKFEKINFQTFLYLTKLFILTTTDTKTDRHHLLMLQIEFTIYSCSILLILSIFVLILSISLSLYEYSTT